MKFRLFTVPALIFALCSPVSAQGPKGGDFAMRRTVKLQQRLQLSDTQANQVYEAFKSTRKNSNCKEKESFTEKRDCKLSAKQNLRTQFEGILSQEQLAQFDEMKEKRKERRKNRREKRHSR